MLRKNVLDFVKMKNSGEKISVLTAFDFLTAQALENSQIDVILVGDSLGMVFGGGDNTLEVTIEDVVYHSKVVRRGAKNSFIIADLPFGDYKTNPNSAVINSLKLIQKGKANAVKMEGGLEILPSIKKVIQNEIPVMAHLGLTPQSINKIGKFSVQSKSIEYADRILQTALEFEKAGCFALVLEMVPAKTSKLISEKLKIPTIGIGSGYECDGQVLVTHDMLGLTDNNFRFVRKYAQQKQESIKAIKNYIKDVKNSNFPSEIESF